MKSLNKRDMTEIRSYGQPPPLVERVMDAVMILRGEKTGWAESKRALGECPDGWQLMLFLCYFCLHELPQQEPQPLLIMIRYFGLAALTTLC